MLRDHSKLLTMSDGVCFVSQYRQPRLVAHDVAAFSRGTPHFDLHEEQALRWGVAAMAHIRSEWIHVLSWRASLVVAVLVVAFALIMKGILPALASLLLLQGAAATNTHEAFESRTYFYAGGTTFSTAIRSTS